MVFVYLFIFLFLFFFFFFFSFSFPFSLFYLGGSHVCLGSRAPERCSWCSRDTDRPLYLTTEFGVHALTRD